MAIIIPTGELKTINYFKKEHFNFYKTADANGVDNFEMDMGSYFRNDDENADGIHILNIKADVTVHHTDYDNYDFYTGSVAMTGKRFTISLPTSVTGEVFIKVSFDAYYYTKTDGGIDNE